MKTMKPKRLITELKALMNNLDKLIRKIQKKRHENIA
jgi:hypothetical protein